jgi:hypothetical protein
MRRVPGVPQGFVYNLHVVLIRRQYGDGDSLSLVQLLILGTGRAPVTPSHDENWKTVRGRPAD